MKRTKFVSHMEKLQMSPLDVGFYACAENPDVINLGTAENRICHDILIPKMQSIKIDNHVVEYFGTLRTGPLLSAVSRYYHDYFGIDAQPNELMPVNGISLLVERLALTLCEPGDIVLIPKPCYGCFEPDMHMAYVKVIYIDLANLPERPPDGAKILLLTNPGNPHGELIQNQKELLEWAYQSNELHILTDDVYACSGRTGEKFQSIAGRSDAKSDRVHQVYDVSKDWGLAGFHVGFFYSRNEDLHKMLSAAMGTVGIPSVALYYVEKVFDDIAFRDEFIQTFKQRLISQQKIALSAFDKHNIPVRSFDYSLFIMIDLRDIAGESKEQELEVYYKLLHEYRVHLLPGMNGFHYDKPGWFRICFSCPEQDLHEGIKRLLNAISEIRSQRKSQP